MPGNNRPKKIVAVDWDPRTLRIVHALIGKRGIKIDKLLAVAVPSETSPDDPEQMGRLIRRTLDQEGITTRHAIVDVPRDQAILKTLALPTTQMDGLPGMVEIQIAKELPFPVSDAVVDFTVALHDRNVPSGDVLVAAVRREQLEQIEATFHAGGLKLDHVGLRPFANQVAVGALLEHAMPERVVFIDVRPTFMEIDVLRKGALSFSRSASVTIPRGGDDSPVLSITREESAQPGEAGEGSERSASDSSSAVRNISGLVLEVTRSIEAFRAGDPGAVIDHVIVGGDVGVEEALAEAIQKRMHVSTQLYNPATSFGWEPDEGASASAFAASLGLVLGYTDDEKLSFDFLHPKRTVSAAQERLKRAPLLAAVVVLFVAAVGVAFAQYTKPGRDTLAEVEKQIAGLERDERANERFLKVVDQIVAFDEDQQIWVDVLYEIIALLPSNQEIVLNQIDMNQKEGRITLKTRTADRDTPTNIVRALRSYRRDGRTEPRFDCGIGPQTEKKGEKYPYYQDLKIQVMDDRSPKEKSSKRSSGG